MEQLRVDPEVIITRSTTASKRILDAEARNKRRIQWDKKFTLPGALTIN